MRGDSGGGGLERVLTPRVVETSLAVLLAAGLVLVGITATAVRLATVLFAVSFAGLVVLLVAELRFQRRWKLQ